MKMMGVVHDWWRKLGLDLALLGPWLLLAWGCVANSAPTPAPKPPPLSSTSQNTYDDCDALTIVGAKLYPSPEKAPLDRATVKLSGAKVIEVSTEDEPEGPCVVDAEGRALTAGFWNSHVHLADRALYDEAKVAAFLREMLLSRGFTSVLDTGSDPALLARLQRSIESGRIPGPRVAIAGGGFVYENGTPSYLPKGMLPELSSPEQAVPLVSDVLDRGVEGIKIFSGSFQTPTHTIYLPPEIIRAVTALAHERGAFVVSHPTDLTGLVNAVENGVDILAHTAPPAGRLEPVLLERMHAAGVALIPTLKLWHWELERHGVPEASIRRYVEDGVGQLRDYHALGGEVLFGTDAGYVRDFDTSEEFELMAKAGLDYRAILKSLTVAPGRRFARSEAARTLAGRVEAGADADLVMLQSDPAADVRAFARPVLTVRAGRVVYTAN